MNNKKRTALSEEDLLTRLAEEVHHVVNTYVEGYAGIGLLVSQAELQGLAVDFVMNSVEVTRTEEENADAEVVRAVRQYIRVKAIEPQNLRPAAVKLMNTAYNYVTATNPDVTDDTIDELVNEVISDHGVDVEELNSIVESIYS